MLARGLGKSTSNAIIQEQWEKLEAGVVAVDCKEIETHAIIVHLAITFNMIMPFPEGILPHLEQLAPNRDSQG